MSYSFIISEIALQLLPTVYSKGVDSFKDSGIAHHEGWKDDVVAESFRLAETYYDYKENI